MNAVPEQECLLEQRRIISRSDSMALYARRESPKKTSHALFSGVGQGGLGIGQGSPQTSVFGFNRVHFM